MAIEMSMLCKRFIRFSAIIFAYAFDIIVYLLNDRFYMFFYRGCIVIQFNEKNKKWKNNGTKCRLANITVYAIENIKPNSKCVFWGLGSTALL